MVLGGLLVLCILFALDNGWVAQLCLRALWGLCFGEPACTGMQVPAATTRIHGITTEMVHAPDLPTMRCAQAAPPGLATSFPSLRPCRPCRTQTLLTHPGPDAVACVSATSLVTGCCMGFPSNTLRGLWYD